MREKIDSAAIAVLGDGIKVMGAMSDQLANLQVDINTLSASDFCRYAQRAITILHIAGKINSPLLVIPQLHNIAYHLGGDRLSAEVQAFIEQRIEAEIPLI